MSTNPSQIRAGLEPYEPTLTRREITHLLRRATFGADPERVNNLLGRTAPEIVNELVLTASDYTINPLPPKPSWADEAKPNRRDTPSDIVREYNENNIVWLSELGQEMISLFRNGGLRERLTLFWHNHFVTEIEVYELAVYAYRYLDMIRANCIGNFKEFVRAIGLTPAMLIYLNGDTNEKSSPNENYARELLELFTMSPKDRFGNDNYTQQDIEEIARALTGWFVNEEAIAPELFHKEFDEGSKTFLGRTGAFDYNDVVDVIFEERPFQIAEFICTNIYREFVFDEPDLDIVQGMVDIFLDNDFQIEPVVSTLLSSAHFFETRFFGAQIKSPANVIVGMLLETSFDPGANTLAYLVSQFEDMEQVLLDPPDVSGWRGYRSWLSTSTLPIRWAFADELLFTGRNGMPVDLKPMAGALPSEEGLLEAFSLPIVLAEHLIPVPLKDLDLPDVDEAFSGDLSAFPIPQEILDGPTYQINLAKVFLGDVPWYEWSLEDDGANGVLLEYLQFLMQLPEFQLT